MRKIFLLSIFMLSGCVHWTKPGATAQDFDIDKSACLAQSYQAAPVAMAGTAIGTGYTQPAYTNCAGMGNTINCTTTGGSYVPPPVVYVDQNAAARSPFFDSCMYGRGWLKEKYQSSALTDSYQNCLNNWKSYGYAVDAGTCSSYPH